MKHSLFSLRALCLDVTWLTLAISVMAADHFVREGNAACAMIWGVGAGAALVSAIVQTIRITEPNREADK